MISLSNGPIGPDDIGDVQIAMLPPFVFEAFNIAIAANYRNGCSNVMQSDVVDMLVKHAPRESRQHVLDSGWMEVEAAYRKVGWKVDYDKPGYNESYGANFTFTKPE